MTKIDLITGLLGSGKTTFLLGYARYLTEHGQNIAILVNDLGAVNVDMLILKELSSDRCRIEMIAGTADPCCHKRRFKTQLISLGMQHFDRVIVEPSGIFDMDEFFDILHESPLDRWFETGSVLGIVDPSSDEPLTEQMEYLFASQAACCGRLIISKLTADQDPEAVRGRILSHLDASLADIRCDRRFTASEITALPWDSFTDSDYASFAEAGHRSSAYIKKYSPEEMLSTVHYFMHITLPDEQISNVISGIISDVSCGRIYRIKGSLYTKERGWLKINATRRSIETEPVADGQSVLIVIGDNVDKLRIDEHISRMNSDAEYVSI